MVDTRVRAICEARKATAKAVAKAKVDYWEKFGEVLESNFHTGNNVFKQTVRRLCGEKSGSRKVLKDRIGHPLAKDEDTPQPQATAGRFACGATGNGESPERNIRMRPWGKMAKFYGIYSFGLSPYEQRAFRGYGKELAKTFNQHIKDYWFIYLLPLAILASRAKGLDMENKSLRKDPSKYVNDK
ncbi:unnamed protein product [Soboliphyme baturini]|uniref:Cytochrome b-c1 complex subunit 8 n=1 Tax=Soboliphyme baturini TaxID=241478 RepID=A0A183IRX0_9BILA|nr:unnamed protein product [Soboliphyme baturini]